MCAGAGLAMVGRQAGRACQPEQCCQGRCYQAQARAVGQGAMLATPSGCHRERVAHREGAGRCGSRAQEVG
eukprot:4607432-Heterocapsa_arctica.AAC.1